MKGKQLTAKAIRVNLKHGWTLEDFCKFFGISQKVFWDYADSFFYGNTGSIKRQLKKNESIRKSSSKHKKNRESELPEKQEVCLENRVEVGEEPEEETGCVEENGELKMNPEEKDNLEITLTQAQSKELIEQEQCKAETIRGQIIHLELRHEQLVTRKRMIQSKELVELKSLLESYKQKIQETQTLVIALNDELNELIESIDDVNEDIGEKREHLQAVESEIEALKIANIFVYASGEIEIASSEEIAIPEDSEADWISIVANNSELCKTMTMAQIQAITKLIYIIGKLEKYQIVFENEQCQKLFECLEAKRTK